MTCNATLKTDDSEQSLLAINAKHTGHHPVTIRSLSFAQYNISPPRHRPTASGLNLETFLIQLSPCFNALRESPPPPPPPFGWRFAEDFQPRVAYQNSDEFHSCNSIDYRPHHHYHPGVGKVIRAVKAYQ
ncbi:hypothetical protein J6590_068684 [Homalodisca vitripennis]|nr:hypothetical protein J6590_068684 [Homalodisca vitripennis]